MNSEQIIEYLKSCDLVEMGNIVSKVLSERTDTVYKEGNYYETRVLLANFYRELEDSYQWTNWKGALIGQADMSHYDESWLTGNGEPFLQMGNCEKCNVEIHSHAKGSICPICEGSINAT